MGSSIQFLPRRTPWRKPFVERLHGYILEYLVQELPGRVFDDVQSFRSYKAQLKAVIPLSAFIRILVKFFRRRNQRRSTSWPSRDPHRRNEGLAA